MKVPVWRNFFLLVILTLILAVILSLGYKSITAQKQVKIRDENRVEQTQSLKAFSSKSLKLTITVPTQFQVSEKFGTIKISNSNGEININQNGTNFNNLDDYLNDLKQKNHFTLNNQQNLLINNLSAIKADIESQHIYYIFSKGNYTVYSFSTRDNYLYPVLDQIAQSFRYTPN